MQPLHGKPAAYDCKGAVDGMHLLEVTDSSDEDLPAVVSDTTASTTTPQPNSAENMASGAEERTVPLGPRPQVGCVPGVFLVWTTAPEQAGCHVEVSLQVALSHDDQIDMVLRVTVVGHCLLNHNPHLRVQLAGTTRISGGKEGLGGSPPTTSCSVAVIEEVHPRKPSKPFALFSFAKSLRSKVQLRDRPKPPPRRPKREDHARGQPRSQSAVPAKSHTQSTSKPGDLPPVGSRAEEGSGATSGAGSTTKAPRPKSITVRLIFSCLGAIDIRGFDLRS